jgi:hypothetical protein
MVDLSPHVGSLSFPPPSSCGRRQTRTHTLEIPPRRGGVYRSCSRARSTRPRRLFRHEQYASSSAVACGCSTVWDEDGCSADCVISGAHPGGDHLARQSVFDGAQYRSSLRSLIGAFAALKHRQICSKRIKSPHLYCTVYDAKYLTFVGRP